MKPEVRETWTPRATRGWYLGPAMRHYRCYCVGIVKTQAERFADTVALFPTYVSIPTPSSTTTLLSIAYGLTQALLQLRESPPLPPLVVSQTRAPLELANIFKQSLTLPTTERTDNVMEDDDGNNKILLQNEVSPTTRTILPSNTIDNISTIENLYDDATVQIFNIKFREL